ncbi:MAG: hypothetical protein PVI03_07390 [Candidatus Thorarchaeota archaeon]|jgi:hypothetical protein
MTDQLELMVKYLVHLQFYSEEEDILFSRDKKEHLSIEGIGPVVIAFEEEFKRHLHFIRKKEYRAFLEAAAEALPYDTESIILEFNDSVRDLGRHNLTDELAANFLIGPIRTALQTREFETCMDEIRRKAILRLGTDDAKQVVKERISDFYSRNDSTVSMLHNLTLLRLLASLYGSKATQDLVNQRVDLYYEELLAKLST